MPCLNLLKEVCVKPSVLNTKRKRNVYMSILEYACYWYHPDVLQLLLTRDQQENMKGSTAQSSNKQVNVAGFVGQLSNNDENDAGCVGQSANIQKNEAGCSKQSLYKQENQATCENKKG